MPYNTYLYIIIFYLFLNLLKLFKGIGDQPKLLRPSRHPHRLANSIEDKGGLLRQKGSEAVAKGKFPFVYDMWRHTSQLLGSFLRLGGRGKSDTKNVILHLEMLLEMLR